MERCSICGHSWFKHVHEGEPNKLYCVDWECPCVKFSREEQLDSKSVSIVTEHRGGKIINTVLLYQSSRNVVFDSATQTPKTLLFTYEDVEKAVIEARSQLKAISATFGYDHEEQCADAVDTIMTTIFGFTKRGLPNEVL